MIWMNLPEEYQEGEFVIIPISYEKNLTYGKGASKGCIEIIKASEHLEYYDEQYDCEAFVKGIKCLEVLELIDCKPEEMVEVVSKAVEIQKDKFIVSLGGDHSVTIGIVKGLEEKYGNDFSIVQIDAHSDFRDSWNGNMLNHACVMKQICKKHEALMIGIRSQDKDEAEELKLRDDIHIVYGWNYSLEKVKEKLKDLKEKVYITIDVDGFDPSIIRNTGTPEPCGLSWNQVISILEEVFKNKKVIGCDIVEFAPNDNFESEAYALAKLCYKIMNLKEKIGEK